MTTLASKRSICRLLIGVLVSTQLSISAYACSGMSSMTLRQPVQPVDAALAMADPGRDAAANEGGGMGPSYGGIDPALPNLCVAHCHNGQQSADHSHAPALPAGLLTKLDTLPPLGESSGRAGPLTGPRPLAAADPPHAILHCCLRT